jgi:2-oxoglutarate ferredoxin oxidoreductase subunit beta
MTPVESNKFVEEVMIPYYPLGDLKVPKEEQK